MVASYLSRGTLQILLTSKFRGIILNPRAFFWVFIHFGLSYIYIWLVTDISWRATRQLDIHKVVPLRSSETQASKVGSVVRIFSTVSLKLANIWRMKWAHSKCWENIHTYTDVFLSLSLIFQQVKIEAEPWKVGSKKISVAKNIVSKEMFYLSNIVLSAIAICQPRFGRYIYV